MGRPNGCVVGERILALAPDASVFPCPRLVHSTFMAGNALREDLNGFWRDAKPMKEFRGFRSRREFKGT